MREDISFDAEGATLRGWFYAPDAADANGGHPCVVMAHGFSAVKEQHLDDYAEVFAAAGLACVVYDNRGFGASDAAPGKPRQEIDPWEQIRDYQHAITYAQSRDDVDADRIGVWGSSYSGGHVYVRRCDRPARQGGVRAGSAGLGPSGLRVARAHRRVGTDLGGVRRRPPRARPGRRAGDDAGGHRGPDGAGGAADRRTPTSSSPAPSATVRPSWRNEVTLRSIELFQGYEPARVPPADLADAGADGGGAERPAHRRRAGRPRRTRPRCTRRRS